MMFNTFLKLFLFGMLAILTAASPLDTGITPFNVTELVVGDLPPADTTGQPCGKCLNDHGQRRFLYASGKCNTLPDGERYAACTKPTRCGICMLFKGEQCMGDMIGIDSFTGNWNQIELRQAQSHYCISG